MSQVVIDRMAVLAALKNGAVGIMATDTIYGVVVCAAHKAAVARLYELKHRKNKPGTIIAASIHDLARLGIPLRYMRAVEQYWPGSISIVVPSVPALRYLDQGKGSLAVRVPADKSLREFLMQTGPLLTSSANHPAEAPATTHEQAQNYFGEECRFLR